MRRPIDDDPELKKALDQLFSLQTFGVKLGLEPITELLAQFGDPHRRLTTIHVAGTNGKGSVCAMVASTLSASGLHVGLYSSPHLIHFDERIRVDGTPISRERLSLYAREMLPSIEQIGCTFFEGTTAMAFRYFAEEGVDVAVIETGLGGRLDATNVVDPIAVAITSIGYDHMRHLGSTLEEIAREKGGILKRERPAIIGHVTPGARDVIERRAADVGCDVRFVDDHCRGLLHGIAPPSTHASFLLDGREIVDLEIDLVGRHQMENARVAILLLDAIGSTFPIDEGRLRKGMGEIRKRSGIRGRFEIVRERPTVILDVAHNVDGARVLVGSLASVEVRGRTVRALFGAVDEKDVAGILDGIAPVVDRLYAVRAENHRSQSAQEIATQAERAGIATVVCGSVRRGVEQILAEAQPDDIVLIFGSFYVVGEAIPVIDVMEGGEMPVVYPCADVARDEPPQQQKGSAMSHLTVRAWSPSEQPRERLVSFGPAALSNVELLAILLRTGTRGHDVVQVARALLERYESLKTLAERDYRELESTPGIGTVKGVTLAAAFELARRIGIPDVAQRPVLASPEDVARIYIPKLRGVKKEQFHVVVLDTSNRVVRAERVSEGNLNSSIVHPREVFRLAIIENAAAIIGLHNHPSGNPTPSREDIAITRQLVEAGSVLGIPFHDHIIIAGDSYISMAEKGYV